MEGVHHIGFCVDDLEESVAAVEGAGGIPSGSRYKGPDGLLIDICEHGKVWDEIVKARTQLLHAVPATAVPASAD